MQFASNDNEEASSRKETFHHIAEIHSEMFPHSPFSPLNLRNAMSNDKKETLPAHFSFLSDETSHLKRDIPQPISLR